ncbi:MAG: hypothetical protein ACP5XB_16430, partial [Isosphaeraceae bacterium]
AEVPGSGRVGDALGSERVFEIVGLGYADPDIIPAFADLNAAYDPRTIHQPLGAEYKEFNLGRRRPWAEDRVM